ncbi:2-amino-3-ketobutyrate coenzyme A ligase [hydrothermal vent metagenome]|uniref:2-amino-3-ketobutyrate coenzyme A ligase n=1 Tax=hydrothermal vent metagenome TaxID=652676 RepID=A0A3B0UN08_9ZZZZ
MGKSLLEKAYQVIDETKKIGIGHLSTHSIQNGLKKAINIHGEKVIPFSLSDYLMLMHDERIIAGAIASIKENGFNLSISREFLHLDKTDEAEEILAKVFHNPVVLYPKTTLAHVGALPLLIDRKDAVILDHHVHATIQMASDMVRARGTHIEVIRHNNLEQLEQRIIELRKTHKKIWYLADGVYSMYGDVFPAKEIEALLNKYEEFYVYVDDAHGISWAGPNGSGYVLSQIRQHPKMILAVSFGKGFGVGGGAIVCPDDYIKKLLVYLSGPLMFTGPLESTTLGGLIASSKIHLSPEIVVLQDRLKALIDYFYTRCDELGLPLVSKARTPTAYFPMGKPENIYISGKIFFDEGFSVTAGLYPAVPVKNAGLRVQITLYQDESDVEMLLQIMKKVYDLFKKEQNFSIEETLKHFKG